MTDRRPALAKLFIYIGVFVLAVFVTLAVTGTGATNSSGMASQITAGDNHSCAVVDGAAKCWGDNQLGQLGVGTYTGPDMCTNVGSDEGVGCSKTPAQVTGLTSGVDQVSAGDENTCALLDGGGVMCWGGNASGQLGIGTNEGPSTCDDGFTSTEDDCSLAPVAVQGLDDITQISVGGGFACALNEGGGVKCWGTNNFGQLGGDVSLAGGDVGVEGDPEDCNGFPCATLPVDVPGLQSGVQSISAGSAHACALMETDGSVMCWGWQRWGRLGNGVANDDHPDAPMDAGVTGVLELQAGGQHTCVLINSGVQCWGGSGFGALGIGSSDPGDCGIFACSLDPITPDGLGSGVEVLSDIENLHTCVKQGVGVQCWGRNSLGAVGVPYGGPNTGCDCALAPVDLVQSPPDVAQIATGRNHTCALRNDGGVECWGHTFYGQLGNGYGGGGSVGDAYHHLPAHVVGITGNATPAPTEPPPLDLYWGDWDCTGEVDLDDPLLVMGTLAGLNGGTQASGASECPFVGEEGGSIQWGDINCSEGDVDLRDALDLFLYLAGVALTGVPVDCPEPGDSVG